MVAEAGLITRAEIASPGLHAAMFLVGLEQERGVEDATVEKMGGQRLRKEHVVEHVPFALEAISGLSAIASLGAVGHILQSTSGQQPQTGRGPEIVEVARHDHHRLRRSGANGVDRLAQAPRHLHAVCAREALAPRPARGMHHIDMERVARDDLATGI